MHVSTEVVDAEQERDTIDIYDINVDKLSRRSDILTLQSLVTPLEWVWFPFRAVLALSIYDTDIGDNLSTYRAVGEFEASIKAASLGWFRATWIGGTSAALRRCSAVKNMDAS